MGDNQKKYHDQIDAYLRDELSIEDRSLFEKALLSNPELEREFYIHQELFTQFDESSWINESFTPDTNQVKEVETYFRGEEAQKFKETVDRAKENYQRKEGAFRFNKKIIFPILAAASITLLVLLYTMSSGISSQDLYAQYSNWNDLPSLTSRSDESQLAEGQLLFEQGAYLKANTIFKSVINSGKKTTSSVLIYAGVSALELGNYQDAISYFDSLIASDVIDHSKGYWYKALLYLKQDKKKEAISVLEIILKNENNYNYQKAEELLDMLK